MQCSPRGIVPANPDVSPLVGPRVNPMAAGSGSQQFCCCWLKPFCAGARAMLPQMRSRMQRADAAIVTAFLRGVSHRRMAIAATNGAAIGLVVGALLFAVRPFDSIGMAVSVALAAAVVGAIAGVVLTRENQH